LVEGGIGSAITYLVAVVADHGEEGRSCWLLAGGWEPFVLLVVRVAYRELKGRLGVDSGYVLHCSLCKSEQWRVKRKNTERWMRSMKKLLHQNLRLNLIFSGPMNQTAASFFNQTPYYGC
jgi:hypothetical protein